MTQQQIITNKDNPVIILFTGVDLTTFSDIVVIFGADTRTLLLNPLDVLVNSATELQLEFQDTTETGNNYWDICGFNATFPNGFELTSRRLNNLSASSVL